MIRTKGVITEFVNPKYADETKTKFKAPTRLECMMQDYPKLLENSERVGFTTYEAWFCFTPAKNNLKDAAACVAKGLPAYSASSAEWDFFNWNLKMLEKLGNVEIERNQEKTNYGGIDLAFGPMAIIHPSFALTFQELKEKIQGNNKVSKNSFLVLQGEGKVENLDLDGTLRQEGDATGEHKAANYTQIN